MAEARITVNFTPSEFDMVRSALEWVRNNQDKVTRDKARADAFLLGEILGKLK